MSYFISQMLFKRILYVHDTPARFPADPANNLNECGGLLNITMHYIDHRKIQTSIYHIPIQQLKTFTIVL